MGKRHIILYTIDRAVRILLWTKGELLLVLGPLFTGILFDSFTVGCLWAGADIWAMRLFKRRMGAGRLKALLYKYFPPVDQYKGWPPSHVDYFVG